MLSLFHPVDLCHEAKAAPIGKNEDAYASHHFGVTKNSTNLNSTREFEANPEATTPDYQLEAAIKAR